ncbi:hypothetical protein [Halomonas sp.]|uniref:hypothetical protein n=1 Tax=Halomonas sp. TaxID=1486246 RepID=UPI003566CC74
MENQGKFVSPSEEEQELGFYTDSPKGVIKNVQNAGAGADNSVAAPQREIQRHREIAYADPHVKEAVWTLVDWIAGDGFNISPQSFEDALQDGTGEIAALASGGGQLGETATPEYQKSVSAKLEMLMKASPFWRVFINWIYYAIVDGHAFMELIVEDGRFEPRLLPSDRMKRETDEFGRVIKYILEAPGGGEDDPEYEPHEVAELYFQKEPTEDFGRSFIESIAEAANILRDLEIDYARFIATKAYPPILWQLGTEEDKWTPTQIDNWLETLDAIEPDSMLAAGHDVDFDTVGVTSTSSTAGAMRLEDTFLHFQDRIITGLGVPALLMNMEGGGGSQGEAVATMPSFKRRIRRLQTIVKTEVEEQILRSLMFNSLEVGEAQGIIPTFEFGEYSAAEERLEADVAINLMNNMLLTPDAAARRAGIDPDSELPDIWDNVSGEEQMALLQALAGSGDNIQNPDGGSPTDTGGGAESSGGEVTSRQDTGADSSNGRNRKSVTEDENA